MNSAIRSGAILVLAGLLQACGGSGGDGGGGGGNTNAARLTVDTTEVTVAAEPGDIAPVGTVTLTVSNPPDAGLYIGGQYSSSGIETLDAAATSETQAELSIFFRLPASMADGTYNDQIELQVCTDQNCNSQIRGSPVTISTHYTVSGGRIATLSRDSIAIEVDSLSQEQLRETVQITLDRAAEGGFYVEADHTTDAILYTNVFYNTLTQADVEINFLAGQSLPTGVHDDTVTLRVCYDASCARELQGSPFTVSTHYTVTVGAEPGYDPLPVLSRVALPHDVVDAEFSKSQNVLVMVGTYPSNAIYVYDVATGEERSQALPKPPMAVSVSPDGASAAVGHDALVSVFDLASVGQPGAPAPILLNVASDMFDLVMDGNGFVHVFPATDQWVQPHSIEIATNIETLGSYPLRAGSHARLHPGGDWIYTADNGLSPSDIQKWDITTGAATLLYDSPYHGDYGMCGDLWFSESGDTIYTACGNTFRTSALQAQDMTYTGAIELSPSEFYGWAIRSLSQSDAAQEIALVEAERYTCDIVPGSAGPCYTHLAFYESTFLNPVATYSIGPVTVDGVDYAQQGWFVFHDGANGRKYLIGSAHESPDPNQRYFLSVVE